MMPVAFARQPKDATLAACLRKHRRSASASAWKNFRSDECGARALRLLRGAYGTRCLYCDHADGWTIDHATAKSKAASQQFAWANWRPSCMDCNNKKGRKRVVDPVRQDPREYVLFDLSTGEPSTVARGRSRSVATATKSLLDNQTLNDARRFVRDQTVALLRELARGSTEARAKVEKALTRESPHRAIVRELILEEDGTLNPYREHVTAALQAMPELLAWAKSP